MIGLRINDQFLEIGADASLEIEVNNPLFNQDTENGLLTYDITVSASKTNKQLLAFAGSLGSRAYRKQAWPCQLWLGERLQLFRVGKLNVLNADGKSYSLNFQSDSGDMATAANDKLNTLDLGTDTLYTGSTGFYPDYKYALPTVKNPGFYDGKNSDFKKYLNYYYGGFFATNSLAGFGISPYAMTPMPFLCHILERVFSNYGYQVTGDWFSSTAAQKLCIYNTFAMDRMDNSLFVTAIDFRNHVPDITVGDFLKSIRKRLGLAYVFDSKGKSVEIVKLADALIKTDYDDWSAITQPDYIWYPNQTDGFVLGMLRDDSDDELKAEPSWLKYTTGSGKDSIDGAAGTLAELTENDEINPSRTWTIPVANQKGNSVKFGLGTTNKFGLRLLSYEGISGGQALANVIHWSDTFADDYEPWLNFLSETDTITRTVRLGMLHLQQLHPLRKILIKAPEGTVKAFWQKVQFTITAKKGITAKVFFFKTMQ